MAGDRGSVLEGPNDQQQQGSPTPVEDTGSTTRDDELALLLNSDDQHHAVGELSESYLSPASDISDDEWQNFGILFEPDTTDADVARIGRLARGLDVSAELLKDRIEMGKGKVRIPAKEDDGDHENDSISYSSEETASDWSNHYEPREPMDAVIEEFKERHEGGEPSDHFPFADSEECRFDHRDPKKWDCPCAKPGHGPHRQTCLPCVMSAFDELGDREVSIPVPYADHLTNHQPWERQAFRIWRRAVASLLPAGEMKAITGIRQPRPRTPCPQRRFGPLKALRTPKSKDWILAVAKGNRFVANRLGLERGIKPCNEGIPWLTAQDQWNLSCPNSLNPDYNGEIRRCREIGCQDENTDPVDEQWLTEAEAITHNPPPPGHGNMRSEVQCNSSVEAKVAKTDARLYTQRPCTPNGYRYVCAEHLEDTHRLHQVQDMLEAHRVAPCPEHVKVALQQYPEGYNSCTCEEPLKRWQCRSCFEHKTMSQKRHFQRRVANPWTGLYFPEQTGVDKDYHRKGQWVDSRRLLVIRHPCLHAMNGPDPTRQYLCGKARSREPKSIVLDCRACGGLVVLPPHLRTQVHDQENEEDDTESTWSQLTVAPQPPSPNGAPRDTILPPEKEQTTQALGVETPTQQYEAAAPFQQGLAIEHFSQIWGSIQTQPNPESGDVERPDWEIALPYLGISSEASTPIIQAEVMTTSSEEPTAQQPAQSQDSPQTHQDPTQEEVQSPEEELPLPDWSHGPELPTSIMQGEVMAPPLREPESQQAIPSEDETPERQSSQRNDDQPLDGWLSLPDWRYRSEPRSISPPSRAPANRRPRTRRTPAAANDRILRNRTRGSDQFFELGENGKAAVHQGSKRKRN